jgi:DNA processing protein
LGFIAEHIPAPAEATISQLDPESSDLLDTIGYDPVSTDVLVERSGLTIDKLSSMLLLLELNDLIESAPGGCYVRI